MEKRPRNCYNRDLSDTSPIRAYDSQDNSFAAAFSVIRQAVADRAFPGASLAVTHADKLIVLKSFGSFVQKKDLTEAPSLSRPLRQGENFDVKPATVFDVASLTKPIATTTMAMLLYERGLLELDAPVAGTVPEILEVPTADPRRREITFRMLLAHSSGLPAYEKLFLKATSRTDLLKAAFTTPLMGDPGTRAEYSDIGFIILGVALERIAGEPLDRFCQREVFWPPCNESDNIQSAGGDSSADSSDGRRNFAGCHNWRRICSQHIPQPHHPGRSTGRECISAGRSCRARRTVLQCRRHRNICSRDAAGRRPDPSA